MQFSQVAGWQPATCNAPTSSHSTMSPGGWPHPLAVVPQVRRPRQRSATAALTAEAGDSGEGDSNVQDNLVSMLRIQIGKQTVNDIADTESERLRQSVDEVQSPASAPVPVALHGRTSAPDASVIMHSNEINTCMQAKAEVDKLAELTRDRANLSFGSAMVLPSHLRGMDAVLILLHRMTHAANCVVVLSGRALRVQADINQQADEFEEQLLRSRLDMEVRAPSPPQAMRPAFFMCCCILILRCDKGTYLRCACRDQADQEKFREWQKQMAVDRSRGHFFKSLYQVPADPDSKLALRDPQVCQRPRS